MQSESDFDEIYETTFQRLMRKYFIPTSAASQRASLQNLLGHHCKNVNIEYKMSTIPNGFSINYVDITPKRSKNEAASSGSVDRSPNTLVLLHGYGSGLGFFYENYESLASRFDRVLAVDWPGMGGSSRAAEKRMAHTGAAQTPSRNPVLSAISHLLPQSMQEYIPWSSHIKAYSGDYET